MPDTKENKQSKIGKLWGGVFTKGTDELVEDFTESISFDYRLYKEDIKATKAHLKLLGSKGIFSKKEVKLIQNALLKIEQEIKNQIKQGDIKLDKKNEDIHTYILNKVINKVGHPGRKLHYGRSRNDLVATDLRLYIKKDIDEVIELLAEICGTINGLWFKYRQVKIPSYTHMQFAKPIYFRDYIRVYRSMFKRDMHRLINCKERMDECPLGSGAVGGIHKLGGKKLTTNDRKKVAKWLGFKGIIENAIDAVSDRDFVIEYVSALSLIMVHLSRLSEDLIIMLSPEFEFVNIDRSFMTGSSIMPQKQNPDICELVRGKTSRVIGNLTSLLVMMKGLPQSYNRDMQEDKEALFDSSDTVKSSLKVYDKMLMTLELNKPRIKKSLEKYKNISRALYLADTLADKLSQRVAHRVTGEFIKKYGTTNEKLKSTDFTAREKREFEKVLEKIQDDLAK